MTENLSDVIADNQSLCLLLLTVVELMGLH